MNLAAGRPPASAGGDGSAGGGLAERSPGGLLSRSGRGPTQTQSGSPAGRPHRLAPSPPAWPAWAWAWPGWGAPSAPLLCALGSRLLQGLRGACQGGLGVWSSWGPATGCPPVPPGFEGVAMIQLSARGLLGSLAFAKSWGVGSLMGLNFGPGHHFKGGGWRVELGAQSGCPPSWGPPPQPVS